jgi:hypothetical protein
MKEIEKSQLISLSSWGVHCRSIPLFDYFQYKYIVRVGGECSLQPVRQRGTRTHIFVFRLVTIQRERGVASGLARESGTLTWESRRVKRELTILPSQWGIFHSIVCWTMRSHGGVDSMGGSGVRSIAPRHSRNRWVCRVLCLAQDL